MDTDILIRRARPGDGQAMSDYLRDLVGEKLDTILLNVVYSAQEEEEIIASFRRRERCAFLLMFDSARVVGMLDISCGSRPGNRHAASFGMSIAASHRGQGLGRRLLQAAIETAKAWEGCCRIELGVTPWNTPARTLYESLGFKVEGIKRKGINLRGQPEDDLMMGLVW